jgi:hypothetical protein
MKTSAQEDLARAVEAAVDQKYGRTLGQTWNSESNQRVLAQTKTTPQAVYEIGLQRAAESGLTGASAETFAAAFTNEYARAAAFGTEEGRILARSRAKQILMSPEAKGRLEFATYLACETDMPADEAIGLLGKMPLLVDPEGKFFGFNGQYHADSEANGET